MPRYFTSVLHFTHTRKWGLRPNYTSAVLVYTLSSRGLAHPVRASQVGGPAHVLSSSVRTLQRLSILWMLRGRSCARDGTEQNAESEEAFRLLLLIGNVLKMDAKTKPTSKLNCRVIIVIYKLGCQECKKRHLLDIFLNSFELWMNMTKLHRQHFVFFTAHKQNTWMFILHHCYYKNMQIISYQSKLGSSWGALSGALYDWCSLPIRLI